MATKYGDDKFGWMSASPKEAYACGVWKGIYSVKGLFSQPISFKVNKGDRVSFWHDPWCTKVPIVPLFPSCYRFTQNKWGSVKNHMIRTTILCSWNLHPKRNLNDWEIEEMRTFSESLRELPSW